MIQYIIVFLFFALAMAVMLIALHFSQYKKRPSGCCGGAHCDTHSEGGETNHSCYSEKVDFVEKYKATRNT
jgi:hypothetical protein